MKIVRTLEYVFFYQKKFGVQKKFNQRMLTLMTLLLRISPGLGDDKPPDCKARDPEFCSSPCTYIKDKCNGNRECNLDLCSYLYPGLSLRELERCWDLPSDCTEEIRTPTKRGILNKNIAYLLLKLHPFVNQTSQYGFLTSGRFRRITGNFGTEFLGKRSNNRATGSGGRNENPPTRPTALPKPKFYSLPLNKFAKTKVLKRDDEVLKEFPGNFPEKRISIRGNGKVILGSEFLGKRDQYERIRRLSGTEFLGKRDNDPFDGSEFLGKRGQDSGDFSGKRRQEPVSGTELLGKKSSNQGPRPGLRIRRYGNELLGKRLGPMEFPEVRTRGDFSLRRKDSEFQYDDDPELVDEAFSGYESEKVPAGSRFCGEFGICDKFIK